VQQARSRSGIGAHGEGDPRVVQRLDVGLHQPERGPHSVHDLRGWTSGGQLAPAVHDFRIATSHFNRVELEWPACRFQGTSQGDHRRGHDRSTRLGQPEKLRIGRRISERMGKSAHSGHDKPFRVAQALDVRDDGQLPLVTARHQCG
jgi:hypothetical protein